MARFRGHALVGFVLGSFVALACSAPPGVEDDGDSVPDYLGPLPSPGAQLPGNGANPGVNTGNSGVNTGNNSGVSPPSAEAVGNNGDLPIDTSNTGENSGSSETPAAPSPTGGTGGSAMIPPAPGDGAAGSAMTPPPSGGGVGGSSMQPTDLGQIGQGGSGNVPPGNTNPPPPNNPPPVGSGCGAGAIFCEDFDSIALGPLTATVNGMRPDRTVNIVEEAGRGRVLQVTAGAGYGNKSGIYLDNFAPPNNSHFGRAFIRVGQFPVPDEHHWVIVEASLNEMGERVRPVGGQYSRWAPGADGMSAGDWTDHAVSEAVATAGVWECVEWQINGANGANDMALWVNGTEVLPLDRPNFRLPVPNLLWIGWVVYRADAQPSTFDVRFDDVVLSRERIGCN